MTPLTARKEIPAIRKRQLIDAAIEVIGQKGLSGTTLADIAKQAGVGYGNVTFRFKTKDALLLAALGSVADEYMRLRDAAAATPGKSPAERLDLMVAATFDRKVTSQKKIALWHAFLSECHIKPKYRKTIAAMRANDYAKMKSLCEEIIAAGGYGGLDPHILSVSLNALIEGLWYGMRAGPRPIERDDARRAVRVILASLFPGEFRGPAKSPDLSKAEDPGSGD
jgi:TetR/AcrR family transcriptional repressor of bet genes